MRLKRLDTDWWMEDADEREDCILHSKNNYSPIEPRIGVPGIYRMSGESWFETKDGKAFTYPVKDFDWKFKTVSASFLSKKQIKALRMIIETGLSTPKQRELYRFACHASGLRNIRRSSLICRRRLIGK